jgi:hypothetical protein
MSEGRRWGALGVCVVAICGALFGGLAIGAIVSAPMLVLGHTGLYVALIVVMIAVVYKQTRHGV